MSLSWSALYVAPEGDCSGRCARVPVCGDTAPGDSRGRCPACGLFSEFVLMSRPAAEQFTRRRQRRLMRRRLIRLTVLCAFVGGVLVWALGAFFDLGPSPPRATTDISAHLGPHTRAQSRRTPDNSGFTPTRRALSAPGGLDVSHCQAPARLTRGRGTACVSDDGDGRTVVWTSTRANRWEYQSGWLSSSTPAVAGDTVLVAIRPGRIIALHRHTGALRWTTDSGIPSLPSPWWCMAPSISERQTRNCTPWMS